jgi:hypothetical protein
MPDYYEFEVSLRNVKPRIWRRFLIRKTATFHDLHMSIQEACGWWNSHLFEFRAWGPENEGIAGIPDDEKDEPAPDAKKVKLAAFYDESDADRCLYEYDFGDSWEHEVKLRKRVTLPESFKRRLLDGRRAFPPEDCGGVWGYQRCVKILDGSAAEAEEEVVELKEWLCDWTPEAFDLAATKRSFDR